MGPRSAVPGANDKHREHHRGRIGGAPAEAPGGAQGPVRDRLRPGSRGLRPLVRRAHQPGRGLPRRSARPLRAGEGLGWLPGALRAPLRQVERRARRVLRDWLDARGAAFAQTIEGPVGSRPWEGDVEAYREGLYGRAKEGEPEPRRMLARCYLSRVRDRIARGSH